MASNIDTVGTFKMAKTLAKQDSVAMLNVILLIVDLCWPTQAYGAYTRLDNSKNTLFKPQLIIQQLIDMQQVTLRTVSPHNTTPTFSNTEHCNVNEFVKDQARIIAALQVPDTLLRSQQEVNTMNIPAPVSQSNDLTYQIWSCTATLGQNSQVGRFSPELLTDPPDNLH